MDALINPVIKPNWQVKKIIEDIKDQAKDSRCNFTRVRRNANRANKLCGKRILLSLCPNFFLYPMFGWREMKEE